MELLTNETLHAWLLHYGSVALFFLLAVGIIALPIPEETLMVIAGILMNNGDLEILQTIIAACLGSICGITTTYVLGRTAGHYLLQRYGRWVGIRERQIELAHQWFERYGKWTLFFGYFIPGIRHFSGFSAGMTSLEYQEFALFAYSGALLWVFTFLSIGYFFSHYWHSIYENIEISIEQMVIFGIIAVLITGLYLTLRKNLSR